MIEKIKNNRVLTFCMILGIICAMILCGIRFGMESSNNKVAFIMPDSEIQLLADAQGTSFQEYKDILLKAGLTEGLTDDKAVWLIQDDVAYNYLPIPDFTPDYETPMVRVFRLGEEWQMRYGFLGYEGAQEIENLSYRAITDRNMRVVELAAFRDNSTGALISDPQEYVEVIENLKVRIAKHGLVLGAEYSVLEPYSPSKILLAAVAFGACAGGIFLILCVFGLSKRWQYILLAAAFGGCFGAILIAERLAIQIFALGATVAFPCISLWYMAAGLDCTEDLGVGKNIFGYIRILCIAAGITVVGGIFVSALQSSTFYMLSIENFRGVKLSQGLPVGFSVFIVLRVLYGWEKVKKTISEIRMGKNVLIILVVLFLAGCMALFLIRTGDVMDAGVLEQRFRNWMEKLLLVRPRTKEFMISWPCVALAMILVAKGERRFAWPFAILASTGFASVVNTFCHSPAPLWLSLARTVYGLVIGALFGILLIFISGAIKRKAPEVSK